MKCSDNMINDADKKTVLVLSAEPAFRRKLASLVSLEPDLLGCGEVITPGEAFEVIDILWPNVVVIDMSIRLADSLQFCRTCKANYPNIAVIAILETRSDQWIRRAMATGVAGCIHRAEAICHIRAAVREVMFGGGCLRDYPDSSGS